MLFQIPTGFLLSVRQYFKICACKKQMMKIRQAGELSHGQYIYLRNTPYKIVKIEIYRIGGKFAHLRFYLTNILNSKNAIHTFSPEDRLDVLDISYRKANVIARLDNNLFQILDTDTFDVMEAIADESVSEKIAIGRDFFYTRIGENIYIVPEEI